MFRLGLALLTLTAVAACSKNAADVPVHSFVHQPPHGGTPVVLGDGDYHLELVLDRTAGRLDAYVMDDDMEDFVRTAAPSFAAVVTIGGEKRPLVFHAVPNPATGETVGATSLFSTQADWLKTAAVFDVVLPKITVREDTFTDVSFSFPKGNDAD